MVQNHSHDYGTIPCTPAIRSSIWYQAPPSQVFQLSDHERTTSSSTHGCPWPPQWMRNISKAWLSTVVFIKYTPNPDPSNIITRSLSNIYRWQKWTITVGVPGKTSADGLAASREKLCFLYLGITTSASWNLVSEKTAHGHFNFYFHSGQCCSVTMLLRGNDRTNMDNATFILLRRGPTKNVIDGVHSEDHKLVSYINFWSCR